MVALFVLLHSIWFTRVPGDLDAFNFVLGIREFDVADHRPHPPGAPVYMASAKTAVWVWRSLGLPAHPLAGPEAAVLGALSLIAGILCIVLTWRILRVLDDPSPRTRLATITIASTPLVWIAASRQLSDIVGLLLVLGAYLWMLRGRTEAASILAGVAIGIRVQTALLTIPALVITLARRDTGSAVPHPSRFRGKTASASFAWFTAGVMVWLLPLMVVSGGPQDYWTALAAQANEDLSSSMVLAATPTLRNAADALFNTFARPWGAGALAAATLIAALAGAIRLQRHSRRHAAILLVCIAPYVLFHVIFHETATVRYALPVVMVLVYLAAVAIEYVPRRWREVVGALLVAANLFVSVRALHAYSGRSSPAMALLEAMHQRAALDPPAFVTGHASMMLSRLQQVLPSPLPWHTVSPQAPYEWQTMIDHWRRGGSAPVWFVADPQRTDLSLIDRQSQQVLGAFALDDRAIWTVNGLRPKALVWRKLAQPSWIGVKGFALTPEVGGVAAHDRHGPAFGGAVALVRRSQTGAVLAVGGRHVGHSNAPPVRIVIEVDGRAVSTVFANAQHRQYVAIVHLHPDQLSGAGTYATATIRSAPLTATDEPVPVTVEHFDYQPTEGMLFAFGSGWHEPELQTATGQTWRWASRRATLFVHRQPGTAVELKMSGGLPPMRRGKMQRLTVTSAGLVLDTFVTRSAFSRHIILPDATSADACDVEITFESSAWMTPADEDRSADRRELAFRVFDLDARPLKGRSR